jgi:exopolysaccharide biosynthesis polyprenyl glycosylphosphotransferase
MALLPNEHSHMLAVTSTRWHGRHRHHRSPLTVWESRYRTAVIMSDVLATALATLLATVLIGRELPDYLGQLPRLVSVAALLIVIAALPANRAWDPKVLGQGAEEFRRLGKALIATAVTLSVAGVAFELTHLRLWVFFVVPAVGVFAFPGRYVLRRLLHGKRGKGECLLPVMAAGSVEWAADLIARTRKEPHNGWRVEAVCTPDGFGQKGTQEIAGVPVVGGLGDLTERAQPGGYRVVAVAADPYWTPMELQRLAWELEDTESELVVAPVLMELAGPRLHVSGVVGLPLLRVQAPTFGRAKRVIKSIVDRIGALVLVTLLAPVLLAIIVLVKTDDGGPVLFRQKRVGQSGKPFTMWKFRTMVVNADALLDELRASNQGAGPLFKMRQDPRVTRPGRLLRRYSLDELPQLVNVLTGAMSLVGPRPPLPHEVEQYGSDAGRRLLVKPGLTGLWQISGRSDLPWEEALRLDLRYVEDWSLALDAVILWKTVRAVFSGQGAY